ncbi:uncharacterized protein LOC131681554 [Topomyia yanbarensis]|uniref:uncharacterized protein LOC131681554 n=1 Tax=Topomyia yanbarensis TaxID=2498891 RepID=UPI00273B016D|nr:uncharacterized protein LOC131681554 [Topomyia yanbarensis]
MISRDTILGLALLVLAAEAQLSPKVIETKETFLHELHSLQDVIPKDRTVHTNEHQSALEIYRIFDEFLTQNQESIDAVLRVLKLIDHNLENVIQDCVKIFDLDSLDSINVLFVQVTKPLLYEVRDLCELITGKRVDEVEIALEQIERHAADYRQRLDQALKDIASVTGQVGGDHFNDRIQLKETQLLTHLEMLNNTFSTEMDQNFTKYFTKWIGKYKQFTSMIPDSVGYDANDQPGIAALFNFLDFLDNETSVLQTELDEFLSYWVDLVDETLDSVTNGSLEVVDFLENYPLENFLNGEASLKCTAEYYQNLEGTILAVLDEFYWCVDYEQEMMKAFLQIGSVLDSTDKAVDFVLDSYITCAKLAGQFGSDLELEECLADLDELLDQTSEFVERKCNEIYYHVEDAMVFSGVIMGACVHMKARDAVFQVGGKLTGFDECSKN